MGSIFLGTAYFSVPEQPCGGRCSHLQCSRERSRTVSPQQLLRTIGCLAAWALLATNMVHYSGAIRRYASFVLAAARNKVNETLEHGFGPCSAAALKLTICMHSN